MLMSHFLVMILYYFFCPKTKLQEGNVFTGVCLFTGRICNPMSFPRGVGISGTRSLLGRGGYPGRVGTQPQYMEYYGISQLVAATLPTGMHSCFCKFFEANFGSNRNLERGSKLAFWI